MLQSNTGFYFRAFDEVTIDGTTQTAFTGDTNPDGWEVVIHSVTLYLNGDRGTLLGFDSTSVSVSGSNGLLQGNTGSMNITVFGGAGSRIEGNTGGTIKIDRSSDNVVVGNTVQRVRVLGGGPSAVNNRIGGPNRADRNFLTGYGTWDSEGLPSGTTLQLFDTVDTVIENNWIGTTPDGLAQGNLASNIGIGFEGENRNTVIRNNRIAGILGEGRPPHHGGRFYGWAVLIGGSGTGVTMVGNTIGLNANDEPVLGSIFGVDVGNSRAATVNEILIGGPSVVAGNVIAGHRFNGLTVGNNVPQVRISGNSIYGNAALGVDLVPSSFGYGVTLNDPLDLDTGGNGLQNFPVIEAAKRVGAGVRVAGTLHSSPRSDFTLEFFATPECDPTGHGEGRQYLGSTAVSTDGAGNAAFEVDLAARVTQGWVMTATATLEPLGATSEFSACAAVSGGFLGDLNCDDAVNFGDINPFVLALSDPEEYRRQFPNCDINLADCNGDGKIDFGDINPFVALLSGAR